MNTTPCLPLIGLLTLGALATAVGAEEDMIEHGRYLARIGGCNDCHTPGYLMNNGEVPETQWLTGDSFGWRGPWGTTYGSNLRLYLSTMSEDEWVNDARTLVRRPPMPWFNLNRMSEHDLRALYRFVKSLGDPGLPAPAWVPPDQEPVMPYAIFPAVTPANDEEAG